MTAPDEPRLPRLYVMVGIPASGKSTWIEQHLPPSVVRIRLDRLRRKAYGRYPLQLEKPKEDAIWHEAERSLMKAIQERHDVVVDSMALTRDWRLRIGKVAADVGEGHLERILVFLDTPLEVALSRNRGGEKQVLDDVVREMARHLQPPSVEEGFDRLVIVRPEGDRRD